MDMKVDDKFSPADFATSAVVTAGFLYFVMPRMEGGFIRAYVCYSSLFLFSLLVLIRHRGFSGREIVGAAFAMTLINGFIVMLILFLLEMTRLRPPFY